MIGSQPTHPDNDQYGTPDPDQRAESALSF
jgi:hypothetical protein